MDKIYHRRALIGPVSTTKCHNCKGILPSYAIFCGICGERLEKGTGHVELLWPAIIILSAVAAGLVTFMGTGTAARPLVVMWFLLVCPGMTLVGFFRSGEPLTEWTLAVALSLAIDGITAGIALSAGRWSPAGILGILIALSLGGAVARLATMYWH